MRMRRSETGVKSKWMRKLLSCPSDLAKKQNAQNSFESWDALLNSPPPSTAHRQDSASLEFINSTDVQFKF